MHVCVSLSCPVVMLPCGPTSRHTVTATGGRSSIDIDISTHPLCGRCSSEGGTQGGGGGQGGDVVHGGTEELSDNTLHAFGTRLTLRGKRE